MPKPSNPPKPETIFSGPCVSSASSSALQTRSLPCGGLRPAGDLDHDLDLLGDFLADLFTVFCDIIWAVASGLEVCSGPAGRSFSMDRAAAVPIGTVDYGRRMRMALVPRRLDDRSMALCCLNI